METLRNILFEFVGLFIERKLREVVLSNGSRALHGSRAHIVDLEKRIRSFSMFRDRCKRGSEVRANYTRLISRLKSELASAQRAAAKAKQGSKG